jgi:hypothetical protein
MFFADDERKEPLVEIRPDFLARFVPGILYIFIPTVLLVVALYI